MQETGPTVYSPYPRRRQHVLLTELFKDPECWSGRDLNLRPPEQQSGALPSELTGRRLKQTTETKNNDEGKCLGL